MNEAIIQPATAKPYKCKRCGHVTTQTTNHYGATWSWGRYNTCPTCPPWAKYSEYGGSTVWECMVYKLNGREYKILATFPATSQGTADANEYMAKNPNAALLATDNETLFIADKADEGSQVAPKE